MPTLRGTMPYDRGEERPCVWCKQPTDIRFVPAGMPHLGPQPLHIVCGIGLLKAYERWKAGRVLDIHTRERLATLSG